MCQHTCSISVLLVSGALATIGLQRIGWLDRVVLYHKQKLFQELRETLFDYAVSNKTKLNSKRLTSRPSSASIAVEIQPKPESYEDSPQWNYSSVLRLLTLIKESKTAKSVHKALRRLLQPTRRIMMSMKESKDRFPSIKKEENEFYNDVRYSSSEEDALPAPEDQVVLSITNPVEARLPSARISVNLLRQILAARGSAGRQIPSTLKTIPPWLEFVKRQTLRTSTEKHEMTNSSGLSGESNPEDIEENLPIASDRKEEKTKKSIIGTTPIPETSGGRNPEDIKENFPEASGQGNPEDSVEINLVNSGGSNTVDSGGSNTEDSGGSNSEDSGGSNTEGSGGSNTEDSGGSNTEDSREIDPEASDLANNYRIDSMVHYNNRSLL